MNPNGLIPTIEDGKVIIWESNTILRYLAATRGFEKLHPKDPVERSHVERWMDWQLSVLGPPMATLLMGYYRTPPERRDASALDAAHARSVAAWKILEAQLKDGRPFVAGKDLTLADICLGMFVHRWFSYPVERPTMPHLKALYERLGARPPYRTHIMMPVS
jgi:glutathione S-transferase